MAKPVGPIIVTGVGRSGTTFVQHLLCQHPRIWIHGQEPGFFISEVTDWLDRLLIAGQEGDRRNRLLPDFMAIPHYGGSSSDDCHRLIGSLWQGFISGYGQDRPRWGWKSVFMGDLPITRLASIWPDLTWVVCLREPVATYQSLRSTFQPRLSIAEFIFHYQTVCNLGKRVGRVWIMDQLTDLSARVSAAKELLTMLGEPVRAEVLRFTASWPAVHRFPNHYQINAEQRQELQVLDEVYQQAITIGFGVNT